jgi:hypothetical protein
VAFGALIVICAAVLGARALGRLVRERRGAVVLGLALAIPVAALEYRSHPGARTTDEPVAFGPAPAWVTAKEPAVEGMNESMEENARMTAWKKSVEQALMDTEAREHARRQDASTAGDGAEATGARNIAAQEREATRIDLGVARELAKKQAETSNASNENTAAAETRAASGSNAAKEANAANDARTNEMNGSEQSSDGFPTAGGHDGQTGSASRSNGWSRQTEIDRPTKETDVREVARENAIARRALVYSWMTTDRAGHRWVHMRPIHY